LDAAEALIGPIAILIHGPIICDGLISVTSRPAGMKYVDAAIAMAAKSV
jgi:hypothetical protein